MVKKAAFFLAVVVILGVMLAGCGDKQGLPASVATVDGKSISGSTYYDYLNMAWGRQILPMVVEQQVLLNWAEKEGVPVTDEQLDKQIENMKRDGTYEDQVASVGSEETLRNRYREIQARMNLGKKMHKFTDTELKELYENPGMKMRYVHGPRRRVVLIVSSDAKQIEKAAKELKKGVDFEDASMKFSDPKFTTSGPAKTPVEKDGQGPAGLQKTAFATDIDGISKPFTFSTPQLGKLNAILKVTGETPKANLKFAQVKNEIKEFAALQKVMSDPDFQKKLDARKKKSDIKIELPQYKYMVDSIKNPQNAGMGMMPPGAGQ